MKTIIALFLITLCIASESNSSTEIFDTMLSSDEIPSLSCNTQSDCETDQYADATDLCCIYLECVDTTGSAYVFQSCLSKDLEGTSPAETGTSCVYVCGSTMLLISWAFVALINLF